MTETNKILERLANKEINKYKQFVYWLQNQDILDSGINAGELLNAFSEGKGFKFDNDYELYVDFDMD